MNTDDPNDYFQQEAKRYPGSANNSDLIERFDKLSRTLESMFGLIDHVFLVAREGRKLAQESLEESKKALRLVQEHLQKNNQ